MSWTMIHEHHVGEIFGLSPLGPKPLGPLAFGPLPLGHGPTSSYTHFVQPHLVIFHLVPLVFSPSDGRSSGKKGHSLLVQLSLGPVIFYLPFCPIILNPVTTWSNYHLLQSSLSPIIIWFNYLLVQLSVGPKAKWFKLNTRPRIWLKGGHFSEQADFFWIGPEMLVESLIKSPRKSPLSVFQNPRWRPKWPLSSYFYHILASRQVKNTNKVS